MMVKNIAYKKKHDENEMCEEEFKKLERIENEKKMNKNKWMIKICRGSYQSIYNDNDEN